MINNNFQVFRTVYTEESNQLFPLAVEKLQRWITRWHVYTYCFRGYGERWKQWEIPNRSINDEIARRFRIEVIEDPNRLNIPKIKDATSQDLETLCDRFSSWVVSVGGDPDYRDYATTPRFLDFLVIDDDALRSLSLLGDEIPPHTTARDIGEWRSRMSQSRAWLWFFDNQAIRDYEPGNTDPQYRGWMKIETYEIDDAWFTRAGLLNNESRSIDCKEKGEGSGEFWAYLI